MFTAAALPAGKHGTCSRTVSIHEKACREKQAFSITIALTISSSSDMKFSQAEGGGLPAHNATEYLRTAFPLAPKALSNLFQPFSYKTIRDVPIFP